MPPEAGFTPEDVTIDGAPVRHVGVIAGQQRVALAVAIGPPVAAQVHACVVLRIPPERASLRLLREPPLHASGPCELPPHG